MLIAIRDESPLVCHAPDVSEHSNFGTCHIGTSTIRDCTTALVKVAMYRQFARKVGTSANSALICYYSSGRNVILFRKILPKNEFNLIVGAMNNIFHIV